MEKGSFICLSLVFILIFATLNTVRVSGAGPTTLSIVPPPINVRQYEYFTVSVYIYNAVDMTAFQYKVSWDPSFLDYISSTVYSPWWGPAIVPPPSVNEGSGTALFGGSVMDPHYAFTGSALLATITFLAVKSGDTYINISDAIIFPPPLIIQLNSASLNILPAYGLVNIDGVITSYGANSAHGWISILGVVDQWADGWSIFTVPPLGPRIMIYPPPPFNFTIYLARMFNASVVKLNYNASDFWVSGFWEVSNFTNPREIKDNAGLLKGMTLAPGEFSVKGNWASFTLNIQGFESIKGNVTSHYLHSIDNVYVQSPHVDLNHDYKIDIKDIAAVAIGFGSFLGFDRYEFYADINCDLKIDIKDIAMCALNYGKTY